MANTLTFANQTLTDAHIFGGINYIADLNTGEEFSIGNTASSSVNFLTDVQVPLYSKDATNGTFTWTKDSVARGRYYVTEVTKTEGKYSVTAYDAMYLLDVGIAALSLPYPTTVSSVASTIASYLGCTLSGTVNNGSLTVNQLESTMTARQLLGYVAEASGCSVKIDNADHLCFMYYASSGITVTASQYKTIGIADYTCAKIDNVVIFNSVGLVQASAGSGSNTLYIEGNPFLDGASNANATTILNQVKNFQYAPLTCEMFEENGLTIGTTATFGETDTLVMHIESSENGTIASSVGSDSRAEYNKSLAAALADSLASLDLRVEYDVEGGDAIFRASLYKGGTDITSSFDATAFKWYRKTEDYAAYPDGKVPLGTGYTKATTLASMEYGGVIRCELWVSEGQNMTDSVESNILDSSGNPYIALI